MKMGLLCAIWLLAAVTRSSAQDSKERPDLVVQRQFDGPFVVDHERVTGIPGDKTIEAIGIYEVRDGAIRRVWWTP